MPASFGENRPLIVCEKLSLGYGPRIILEAVDLSIPSGAFIPFVGPNGAGKTTLLRCLLGLIQPRGGKLITPFGRKPPGYVPQQKAIDPLYPVSVEQIVSMGFYPQIGWWRRLGRERKNRLASVLDRFDLSAHAHKTYGELSGGMKQKALIARALVTDADVFIMDEPASELDARAEADVLSHLKRLSVADGKTVLMAHHGLNRLAELSETLCLVHRGRARMIGAGAIAALMGDSTRPAGAFPGTPEAFHP
ncbi:MAG: ATP-binding cassette domain-containing protein [Pseudomonadota bacterium]